MRSLFERMMQGAAFVFFWLAVIAFVTTLLVGVFSGGLSGLNRQGPFLIFTAFLGALMAGAFPFGFAALLYRIDKWLGRSE